MSGQNQRFWFWVCIVSCKILLDDRDAIGLGVKQSAPDAIGGQVPEEAFHHVEPGRTGGRDAFFGIASSITPCAIESPRQ